ncbi:MAG: tRNA (guanosine(46)-N7)-methyltransferase TrmB [Campylobacterales bacterium]|nr:tRNA (guanosine(46)-N7)-methyltransferase TrmB [Campylobacterales bacterium]
MPHIKTKPFNKEILNTHQAFNDFIHFRAFNQDEEFWGVEHQGVEFLLNLKIDSDGNYLIKYDKVTRPLKVDLVKEAIAKVADMLELEIIHSNIISAKTKAPLASQYQKSVKDFENIEFEQQRVSLEVGFGSGKHILHQATQNPDKLYIGVEIHTPSAQQLLKQIGLQNLTNIWVVNYDARLLLEMFPSNCLEEIYVHFPVPWDKKPHRRVISPSFLNESMRVLKVDGRLELRTDSDKYFWYALETFFAYPKINVDVRKNRELEVVSKYEARWRRQEKDIYDVYVKSNEDSPDDKRDFKFDFDTIAYNNALKDRLPKESQLYENYFIHFERIYEIVSGGLLLRVAFGSFDRPEHKFIIATPKEIRYLPSSPVATATNYQAHQKLQEFLDE